MLLQFHDSARKTRECALARPFHQYVEAGTHSHSLPRPWGSQASGTSRLHELGEAPPGSAAFVSHRAPDSAKRRAHGVGHDPLSKDGALSVDCRQLAALCGAQLIEMDQPLHALHRALHLPATAIERASCCSAEDWRGYRGKDATKLTEKQRLGRQVSLLFLRLPGDWLACGWGRLLLPTIHMEAEVTQMWKPA